MENKNKKRLFIGVLALALGVLATGLAYISMAGTDTLASIISPVTAVRSSGDTPKPPSYPVGSKERCDELYKKINSKSLVGTYTAEEKMEYSKYCLDNGGTTGNGGSNTTGDNGDTKPNLPTCDELKRKFDAGLLSSTDKEAYVKRCTPTTGGNTPPSDKPTTPNCSELTLKYRSNTLTSTEREAYSKYCSSTTGNGDTNTTGDTRTGGDTNKQNPSICDELKRKLDAGLLSSTEKDAYVKRCAPNTNTDDDNPKLPICDELKRKLDADLLSSTEKDAYVKRCAPNTNTDDDNPSDKPSTLNCSELTLKYRSNTLNASEREAYSKHCIANTNTRDDNSTPNNRNNGDSNSNGNTQPDLDICKELRFKMVRYINTGLANTKDYQELKDKFVLNCKVGAQTTDNEAKSPCNNTTLSDIDKNSEEGKAACLLNRIGIIQGFSDGEFKGDESLTKAQVVKVAMLACNRPLDGKFTGRFRDVNQDSSLAKLIEGAAKDNIVSGNPDGSFSPDKKVNRAEFSTIFSKACKIPENLDYSSLKDVTEKDWFHAAAGAAVKYKFFDFADGLFNASQIVTRNEAVVAIKNYLTFGS